ncbi:MAG TPA: CDP-alcohol phosphatidyltransferase family protein [Streptosporangiaceae bacterium]
MTLAVVVATAVDDEDRPTATLTLSGDGTTVLDRLHGQLASLDVRDIELLACRKHLDAFADTPAGVIGTDDLADTLREVARAARGSDGPLILCAGDVLAHREALAGLIAAPGDATGALVEATAPGAAAEAARPDVRVEHGRIVSAASPYHWTTLPNARSLGVLRVNAADLPRLAVAADDLADLAESVGDAALGDPVALLLVGLVRGGAKVAARDVRVLTAHRVTGEGSLRETERRISATDEERVKLESAVKGDDGLFTTYAVSTYSRYIARWAARRGMSPNAITFINMGVAVLAALWFSSGTRAGMIAGAAFLYFAFVLDCVDGQLARYARKFSTLGAWLDATGDRAKEYIAYAGLAIGSAAGGFGDVWGLATAALLLQTVRHMIDFSYAAARTTEVAALPRRSVRERSDGLADHVALPAQAPWADESESAPRRKGLAGSVVSLSRGFDSRGVLRWAKKIIVLPIGERFALICVLAAATTPRITFIALLAWGGLAACYTLAGRVFRSLAR